MAHSKVTEKKYTENLQVNLMHTKVTFHIL